MSGDLSRHFIAEGYLVESLAKPDLCRTQQLIRLCDKYQASYFLTNPIGNHHIIKWIRGRFSDPLVQVPLAQLQNNQILKSRLSKFTVSADGEFVQVHLHKLHGIIISQEWIRGLSDPLGVSIVQMDSL